jgi:hypothetical protein
LVKTRYDGCLFEHGPDNFSIYSLRKGLKVAVIMSSGVVDLVDSRSAENIFRRGDQSNCLIVDKHTEIYRLAGSIEKKDLEDLADGKNSIEFQRISKIKNWLVKVRNLRITFKNRLSALFNRLHFF